MDSSKNLLNANNTNQVKYGEHIQKRDQELQELEENLREENEFTAFSKRIEETGVIDINQLEIEEEDINRDFLEKTDKEFQKDFPNLFELNNSVE